MTILYRPVLIESAEQAEALPVGAVILSPGGHPAMKYLPGSWMLVGTPSYRSNEQTIGSTALVPIEAEEETRWSGGPHHTQTRLVTPWEDA